MGQCPNCKEWNTIIEEKFDKKQKKQTQNSNWGDESKNSKNQRISEIQAVHYSRISSKDPEFDRVLGGGIVPGAVILIGGNPGIGKSTLLLQVAMNMDQKILYVSGEESAHQIRLRADRIEGTNDNTFVLNETNTISILNNAKKIEADVLVIDSIQTLMLPGMESAPGSVSQVRESTSELQKYAKQTGTPVIIIGHINKEGSIAGPKILEHIVDTVLQFEGDNKYQYRILRSLKNRFGSTDELGIYEMQATGLKVVENPSTILLNQQYSDLSGTAIASSIEGARPMMVETQALVSEAVYGNPQRSATGFDLRRMSMLLAVLEKRCGVRFGQQDVFLNIAGGIKISDPSIDLAICASLVSSLQDIVIPTKTCFAGEVGLTGEVRAVSRIEQRIQESERLGFEEIYISYAHHKIAAKYSGIQIHPIKILPELLEGLFG